MAVSEEMEARQAAMALVDASLKNLNTEPKTDHKKALFELMLGVKFLLRNGEIDAEQLEKLQAENDEIDRLVAEWALEPRDRFRDGFIDEPDFRRELKEWSDLYASSKGVCDAIGVYTDSAQLRIMTAESGRSV